MYWKIKEREKENCVFSLNRRINPVLTLSELYLKFKFRILVSYIFPLFFWQPNRKGKKNQKLEMASAYALNFSFRSSISPHRNRFFVPQFHRGFWARNCWKIMNHQQNPSSYFVVPKRASKSRELIRSLNSVELDHYVTSDEEEDKSEEEEDEMSEGFLEAIEELERMTREPSDILEEMNERLSAKELQLVLVYFAQEGRDSWCALEVFEWLKKENKVDKETMELMAAIMCGWVKKMIEKEHHEVGDVVDLLVDMDCVGFKPGFSMVEKVISLYWEMGMKEKVVLFVKEVLRRGFADAHAHAHAHAHARDDGHKGGPTGYLAWKMMVSHYVILSRLDSYYYYYCY